MLLRLFLTIGAGLALSAQPAIAQDTMEDDPFAAMAAMFEAEPLTTEQQARLPLAQEVVARMIPDGAMAEMMDSMFNGMLEPLMAMEREPTASQVATQLGVSVYGLDMDDDAAAEALAILDPAWQQRHEIEAGMMPQIMANMMTTLEPVMRKAMSEVFAANFTNTELTDINSFFKTESGMAYARKSFTIASDPRMMAASMEAMPDMMGAFATMGEQMESATAELPEARNYDELTVNERARIASLAGLSVEELEEQREAVAEMGEYTEE